VPPPLPPGTVEVRYSDLAVGWSWDEAKLAVWTDFEIFGFRKQLRRGGKRTATETAAFLQSLTPGDYVVHVDHGVALYQGLTRVTTNNVEREYLLLEYQKGEKLYVPTDQSDRVSRYSGGGLEPTLNKLGSGEWIATKRRVKRAVREMAFELVQLYSRREAGAGFQFPKDTIWDAELAESFPYVETPDQLKAIETVTADMESPRPMDRLVCGDVGFGKTEVAIRAAFKAVNAGKQVAVLVPTTVLALQHFATFSQRLAAYPVKVEMLSRLKSKAEQQGTLERLREGTADIVIGTHRLVQRDVEFKNLGLVVVDEEQRFGVRQKEFLKQLKTEVDVLTMSATPIPRTLHMSLAGIRDISMMETAPQSRLPIRTFVTAFTDQLVREVILREVERGGQVYVVHNRVHDIDHLAARLHKIVPEVRVGIGHGQMDEKVLEDVILSFIRQEFEVLLSTTIIESGVDIPNVNTIIIDNADTLGLTQLYQLRGRVGRGLNRAYAYLLYQPHKVLRAEAEERLEAIQEATELGAGLRVAMRDLEIRGAGNILGAEQSGHIASIGYDLYVRLLSQAVTEIRSGAPIAEQGPVTLDLPLTALIPEDYIADTELRLNTYRDVAAVPTLHQLSEKRDELTDRFGDPPEEVEHLLALIRLRLRCEQLGIDSVVEREREIVIRPVSVPESSQAAIKRALGKAVRFTPSSIRIRLLELTTTWQEALDAVLDRVEMAQATERAVAD
ncbi:MAG TPA: transcription-repair coupling factor, partial [Candidatus Limnocylindria bacterium]|nr:transcription-repair coupling factor [Candidatus Limnocylindria bacterium]